MICFSIIIEQRICYDLDSRVLHYKNNIFNGNSLPLLEIINLKLTENLC